MQLLQITLDQQVEVISWRFETCTGALFAMQWTSSHCIVLRKGLFPRVVTSAGNMEELPVHVKIRYTGPWEHLKLPMTSEDWKFNNNVIQLNPVRRLKPPWNTGMKSQALKNGEKKHFFSMSYGKKAPLTTFQQYSQQSKHNALNCRLICASSSLFLTAESAKCQKMWWL